MARHTGGWLMVLRGDCQFMSRAASQDYSADQPGQVRTMGILYLLPDVTAVSTVWYAVNAFQNDTQNQQSFEYQSHAILTRNVTHHDHMMCACFMVASTDVCGAKICRSPFPSCIHKISINVLGRHCFSS